MTRPLIGIDPGLTGAIVLLTHDGVDYEVQEAHFMPTVPKRNGKREVSGSLLAGMLRDLDQDAAVFIELVNAMPAKGGRGMGAASAFNFGKSAGVVRGVVEALGRRWFEITPASWKRAAGLIKQPKERAKAVALQLWPDWRLSRKKDTALAEAALIAYYGAKLKGET